MAMWKRLVVVSVCSVSPSPRNPLIPAGCKSQLRGDITLLAITAILSRQPSEPTLLMKLTKPNHTRKPNACQCAIRVLYELLSGQHGLEGSNAFFEEIHGMRGLGIKAAQRGFVAGICLYGRAAEIGRGPFRFRSRQRRPRAGRVLCDRVGESADYRLRRRGVLVRGVSVRVGGSELNGTGLKPRC
jgi:hypothetical protein